MRLLAASIAVLLVPSVTPAQPIRLTEAEFLAPLSEDHPAVLSLAGDLAVARAAAVAARTLADPELSGMREESGDDGEKVELTLSWQPPHPRRRRLAVAMAEAEATAAAAHLDAELLALELVLREVYAGWAVATARAGALRVHLDRVEELALRERRRAEAGEASGLEARRLDLAVVELRASLARAEAEVATAEAAARGWRPGLAAGLRPELPPLSEIVDLPPGGHPRIVALEAELAAARHSEELARRVLAMPEVVGGWQREEDAGGSAEGPILGLAWPLPLFDRNRADRLRAEARAATSASRLELARNQLAAEGEGRRAAYRRLRAAALEVEAAAKTAAPAVAAATAAFRLGEVNLTDLLDTLRSATAAELAALDLRDAALAAGRELARVSAARTTHFDRTQQIDTFDRHQQPGDLP